MSKAKKAAPVEIVDSVETLMAKFDEVRAAQEIYSTYTQEQVDAIFKAAALAANHARIPLAMLHPAEALLISLIRQILSPLRYL